MDYKTALEKARQMTGREFVNFLEKYYSNSIYKTSTGVFLTNTAVGEKSDTNYDRHSSVFIPNSYKRAGYYRFSSAEAGDNISLLTKFFKLNMKEAVEALAGANIEIKDIDKKELSKPYMSPRELKIPEKQANNEKAIKYLQSRGISRQTINDLINKGLIYESVYKVQKTNKEYSNIVFLNKEKDYGEIRSIYGKFRGMVEGSAYAGSWDITPNKDIKKVYVCEAAIDTISLYELNKKAYGNEKPQHTYVSMGGLKPSTLDKIKTKYRNAKIILAVDSDKAGNKFANKFPELKRIIPLNKDWNEDLQFITQKPPKPVRAQVTGKSRVENKTKQPKTNPAPIKQKPQSK